MCLNVLSVKVGPRYGPEYVNKLHSQLKRHLKRPFSFYCLTDNPQGVDARIIQPPESLEGWWNKLYLFNKDLMPPGPILYLDLDQIILKDITAIVDECLEHLFACYADHISYFGVELGTAWMTFEAKNHHHVFEEFWKDREEIQRHCSGGDQVWLGPHIKDPYFWDKRHPGAVKSFKFHVLATGQPPDEDTVLVNFHGRPKMADLKIPWIVENWQ